MTYKDHLHNIQKKTSARNGLLRSLAGSSWGARTSTLRTGALALVYSAAEYASPVWCRSSHTKVLDVTLNEIMRSITGCLRPTKSTFLPVLAGIAPPHIRRESRVMNIATAARDDRQHILHQCVTGASSKPNRRLSSRRPFSCHAARLLTDGFDPVVEWHNNVHDGPRFLNCACPTPSQTLPPGADLPRKQWVRLNRLRSNTARVAATLHQWGLQESATCACGHSPQTVEHIVTGCGYHNSPGDLQLLRNPDRHLGSWLRDLRIDL